MIEESTPGSGGNVKQTPNHNKLYLILVIIFCLSVFLPKILNGNLFGNKAVDAAEKYVNRQVYVSLGVVCEKYDSDVIYKNAGKQLITVKFYTKGSSNAGGSYCVYCKNNGFIISSTEMMGAEYPYKDRIEELKALFAI